jgi:hypothetical protein
MKTEQTSVNVVLRSFTGYLLEGFRVVDVGSEAISSPGRIRAPRRRRRAAWVGSRGRTAERRLDVE